MICMKVLKVDEPFSGGVFLTYKCTGECKHCMYACSPRWDADWIDLGDAEKVLTELSGRLRVHYPPGFRTVGINYGLHFTGGEPFMNFDLLLELTRMAEALEIPATFVETSCFWCTSRRACEEKLSELRDAGLDGILISVNPFILEHVPLERAATAIEVSREIFGSNVLVYQEGFYELMRRLGVSGTLSLEETLKLAGLDALRLELLPMGRAPYELGHLYRKHPAKEFFGDSCAAELTRGWHFHIDNYFNYITGYCGGLSLGDARDLESICEGVRLDDRPILGALVTGMGELYRFAVEEFGYEEVPDGYISKCHLCVDIRKHIAQRTGEFKELRPREFYSRLNIRRKI